MMDGDTVRRRRMAWPSAMRALANRDFRLYFFGQAISIIGTWIQQVALSWLVYRLTGSAALLGITAFGALVPQLVIAPLAGAWIDRHDKRRLLIVVQGLLALQAVALSVMTVTEVIGPTLIVVMSVVLGVLNAFDTPLRQSLIGSFVPNRADLPNALALNAMLFNSGRFIGPPLAGLLVGLTSEAFCFAVNAGSFFALMLGVALVRAPAPPRARGSTGEVFREGLRFAWSSMPMRSLIFTLAMVNVTASSYAVLLPIFAKDIFAGDAQTLGWLWGAAGCGAFGSTVFLASRKSLPGLVQVLAWGIGLCALAMMGFAYNRAVPVAVAAMMGLGFGISVCNVGINMMLQSLAPDQLRGRVVSFFTSTRFGLDAVGGLLAGFVAAAVGAPLTLFVAGTVLLCFAAWFFRLRARLNVGVAEAVTATAEVESSAGSSARA